MKHSLVTIGLPVFNGENFLRPAIESILGQSYGHFELVISDNGSVDATQEICEQYVRQDNRIRYIRRPMNIGAIANFNQLVDEAHGDYFKWAAHDDVCKSTFLERCVEILDTMPHVVWCHCDSDMIDRNGVSWLHRVSSDDEELEIDHQGNRRWAGLPRRHHDHARPSKRFSGVLLGTRWCVDHYGLIRLKALKQTWLLPGVYGAEKVLMGELSLLGATYQIPETLFSQRVHVEASGYQDSADAQRNFAAAGASKPFASSRLMLLWSHWKVVKNAKINRWEKLCCHLVLVKYILQFKKWRRVITQILLRQGVGGGGRRILDSDSQPQPQGERRQPSEIAN